MRRAVVTGGAGVLGSDLCERLFTENYDVLCVDNFLTGAPANVQHLLTDRAFRLVRCDVTDCLDGQARSNSSCASSPRRAPSTTYGYQLRRSKSVRWEPCTR